MQLHSLTQLASRSICALLLIESLTLCSTGALLGIGLAGPMVTVLSRYAARFSVRALDLQVDVVFLCVAVALALVAAVLLAFIPRLPTMNRGGSFGLASGSVRVTGTTARRLNVFAITQIGASFVLLAGAVVLLRTFLAMQSASPGVETTNVLAIDLPVTTYARTQAQIREFYRQVQLRIGRLPGVEQVAIGSSTPWRDTGGLTRALVFNIEGGTRGAPGDDPRAKFRSVSPGFFASLGVPIAAGRDFNADDIDGAERVAIVSQSVAEKLFAGREVLNRRMMWTDGVVLRRHQRRAATHRRRGTRRRRRAHRRRADDDGVPPVRTRGVRRPGVRAYAHRSVSAGTGDHSHRS